MEIAVRRLALLAGFASILSIGAVAGQRGPTPAGRQPTAAAGQRGGARPVGHGYIPARGPAPVRQPAANRGPRVPRRPALLAAPFRRRWIRGPRVPRPSAVPFIPRRAASGIYRSTRTHRTSIRTLASGQVMNHQAGPIRVSTSIVPGRRDASHSGSVLATCFGLKGEMPSDSGLKAPLFRSRPSTSTTRATGTGRATTW